MGSGVWFKNIISKKKVKGLKRYSAPQIIIGCKDELCLVKKRPVVANGRGGRALSVQDAAATKIQTAYRAYSAKRSFRRIRGMTRLHNLAQRDSVKNQASTTLTRLDYCTGKTCEWKLRGEAEPTAVAVAEIKG